MSKVDIYAPIFRLEFGGITPYIKQITLTQILRITMSGLESIWVPMVITYKIAFRILHSISINQIFHFKY